MVAAMGVAEMVMGEVVAAVQGMEEDGPEVQWVARAAAAERVAEMAAERKAAAAKLVTGVREEDG